jgi:hypothetical protein
MTEIVSYQCQYATTWIVSHIQDVQTFCESHDGVLFQVYRSLTVPSTPDGSIPMTYYLMLLGHIPQEVFPPDILSGVKMFSYDRGPL